MPNQAIVAIVVVILGLVAIALHRVIPAMIHGALKMFFGEPVADDAVRGPSAKVHVLVVGVIIVAFGGFMFVSGVSQG
ncbi:hypothetical protein [Microbacterium sp. MYb45]|uniref:hypothetical protein n=1 Tax=Microbacterium sp. MYb45 TaxID=1827294 RepID=UPI0011B0B8CD|nr:hypothetical protein [Microbacterium sp. MYb45]